MLTPRYKHSIIKLTFKTFKDKLLSQMLYNLLLDSSEEELTKACLYFDSKEKIFSALKSGGFEIKSVRSAFSSEEEICFAFGGQGDIEMKAPIKYSRDDNDYKAQNQMVKFLESTYKSMLGYKVEAETQDRMSSSPGYSCYKIFLFFRN